MKPLIGTLGVLLVTASSVAHADVTRTVNPANPTQLETEIRRIPGFPKTGVSVYQLTGQDAAFVFVAGTLSPNLTTALDATIAAHVPNFSDRILQQSRQTELLTNPLCDAVALSDVDTQIDAGVAGISDLASAKVFLANVLKKIARCMQARAG